jgi:hypothetical protein
MTDQPLDDDTLDTEGHGRILRLADAERAEGDDTEGHGIRFGGGADAERSEGDDTEGNMHRNP